MQFSTAVIASTLAASALAASNSTVVVTEAITVTDYTTYCPEPTVITVTVCEEEEVCTSKEIEVLTPGTITITETCVVETTYLTVCETLYQNSTVHAPTATQQPQPIDHTSVYDGGANKKVAGALAGVAMLAAALV
ncbi:putative GPI-anchored protein 26 [Spathaspora sp. JA1]|nr:putative GPI-anchored protein 26 [Spathaspora sp. JA1]